MHDIRAIRENPAAYDRAWASRGLSPQTPALLELDTALRAAQTALQEAQSRRNEASKQIGQAKGRKDEAGAVALMAEVDSLKGVIADQTEAERSAGDALRTLLAALPNLPAEGVPVGEDETGNVEQRRWGEPFAIKAPKDHVDLGQGVGLMDFEAAARMSGSRFVVLKGELARLERALGQFMLDIQTREHGYTEVSPPLLVRDEAVFGVGQLPKFAEDLFRTTEGRWLISTAEVSLTNLVREQITPEEELPLRFTGLTPCFRSEAGASGRDTRGMIRQHQFYKVELVAIASPDRSEEEHERMLESAEAILKRLELPFRTVLLCSGDMGFSARKTFDLEVWLPSQETYREISSISNCGDFQARRMDARCKRAGDKGTRFVHTLNGSGLAVGRTLVALMENYQDEGGRIAIPQVLQSYMGGLTHIGGAA
ncbi:MAG TPA: serine--tRNA ligase [Caulobacteraceae bacterium]|jgi:seryl-tRNA synthetase|nr:serine--tRNA ligase [Caulobacteraceae bacterium]